MSQNRPQAARWRSVASDVLYVAGVCGVAGGAWMVYPPAGPIAAGVFAIVAAVALSR